MKTFTKRILLLASILLIWNITAKHVNPLFVPEPVTVFDDLIGMIHTGPVSYTHLDVYKRQELRLIDLHIFLKNMVTI